MDFSAFSHSLEVLIAKHPQSPEELKIIQFFMTQLSIIGKDVPINEPLAMTRATLIFEGFYRYQPLGSLKDELSILRAKRWEHHFGTPTITFLLTYKLQIDATSHFFSEPSYEPAACDTPLPWMIDQTPTSVIDRENHIMANPASFAAIPSPESHEITGIFTKTHNPLGGFTTTPCDPVSQTFITHAALSAQNGGKILEIGAAFGAATLEAIAKGATVFCNDIDPENLAVVRQRYLANTGEDPDSITGDGSKLILVPGTLPQELIGLPKKAFDAILICRVLHFFPGSKIEESLTLLSTLLSPGGKVYIVCETPFLKNWQRFIPEFNKRVESGVEWPGEITEPAEYESSGRAASLPKFVHWITKEVLERSLIKAGFSVEHAEYINREGQFPNDLLLPECGKESVGAIGRM